MKNQIKVSILALFTFISCDIEPIDSAINLDDLQNPNNPNVPTSVFKADFNGQTWIADQVEAQIGGDYITIGAIKGSQEEGFGFIVEANQTGTYPANTNLFSYNPPNSEFGFWGANPNDENENTGSITITNIDTVNHTISGTFTFKGYWTNTDEPNVQPIQFTNGVFTNIPYTDYTDEDADVFYAKVNGTEFVDTDILVASVNDVLGIAAKNATFQSITVGINESYEVGTYTISGNQNVQATYVLNDNTTLSATSGTITITEKTADRIKGTFNFVALDETTSPITTYSITQGSFDVAY